MLSFCIQWYIVIVVDVAKFFNGIISYTVTVSKVSEFVECYFSVLDLYTVIFVHGQFHVKGTQKVS